jgi:hypothetical protein
VAVPREPGQPIVSVESIDELDRRFGTRGLGSRLPLQFLISGSASKGRFDPNPDPNRDAISVGVDGRAVRSSAMDWQGYVFLAKNREVRKALPGERITFPGPLLPDQTRGQLLHVLKRWAPSRTSSGLL